MQLGVIPMPARRKAACRVSRIGLFWSGLRLWQAALAWLGPNAQHLVQHAIPAAMTSAPLPSTVVAPPAYT